jgi:anionic cell wall polymer biosynthesis LytR-Cps2A-Psr (LCP) family protein
VAYYYGMEKSATPGGLLLAKSAVSEVIGQQVDYVFVFDFSLFGRIIDTLEGVDVNVERSFDDYLYPVEGKEDDTCGLSSAAATAAASSIIDEAGAAAAFPCRYEHISFTAGLQRMDGATALKYVRSRHAVGEEGTDFDRSRRQENIILAIKNKLLSKEVMRHPRTLLNLYNLVFSSMVTDFPADKHPALFRLALSIKDGTQRTFSLKEPDQLENPPISAKYDFQWVLIPKENNPQLLHQSVSSLLE